MMSIIKRRSHQIVHRRIHDGEIPVWRVFQIFNTGEQQSRVSHQRTSGLNQDPVRATANLGA